jgi:hypothetical protein
MCRAHSVRRARIDLERRIANNFRRQSGRIFDGHDLIVIAMQDQSWHIDSLQILGEISFGKRFDGLST